MHRSRLAIPLLLSLALTAAQPTSANQVLLFAETLGTSLYQTALDQRGYPYKLFSDETSFNQAVQDANPSGDVVVVDSVAYFHSFDSLPAFVLAGGRALLEIHSLSSGSSLATAFQVNVSSVLMDPQPVYNWGGSTLLNGLGSPLSAVASGFATNVFKLQPLTGAQALAGFTSLAGANQAALVLGQSGRTIVHGFLIEDLESDLEALHLAKSELDYLFGALAPDAAPDITAAPGTQAVVTNCNLVLHVAASGSLPLAFRWLKEGQELPGATNDSLTLSNVQAAHGGDYSVVVSNSFGLVTSTVAKVSVRMPQPISGVVLLVDHNLASPCEDALASLALPYQRYNDDASFAAAVAAADPTDTLVVADSAFWTHHFSELAAFVQAGGRAILQYWGLSAGSHLAAAFGASVVHQNLGPLPVYAWGASDLFAGVGSPLTFFSLGGGVHGQTIQPLAGAQGVAGFSSTRAANQAALVEGNAGRTLLNGFLLVEAAAAIAADQLTSNETLRFFPLRITGLAVTNGSATLNWISLPGRNYQVQFKPFLNGPGWTNLGASVTASNTTAQYEDAGGGAQRFYRVVIAP